MSFNAMTAITSTTVAAIAAAAAAAATTIPTSATTNTTNNSNNNSHLTIDLRGIGSESTHIPLDLSSMKSSQDFEIDIQLLTNVYEETTTSMANPIPEEASTEKPHAQLFIYTLKKFIELVDSGLADGKELLQHVVDEFSAQENNNEEFKEKLEKCKKLLADIKELDTRDDSDEMFDKFYFLSTLEKLMGKSDATESEEASHTEPTSVDKQFFESFERHGKENFEKKYNEKFEEFAKDFITVSDILLYSTTVEDWPERPKYIDWFNKFKAEENLEKRIDMFDKFIPFFL